MSSSFSPILQSPGRVLVADDEDSVRNLLCKLVELAGGSPTPARSATEARDLFARHHFLAAVVDKNLPDGTGLELLKEFKAEDPAVEVLLVTGYANLDSAIEALRLGAFDYLVKPFEVEDAVARVRRALERRAVFEERDVAIQTLRGTMRRLELESVRDPATGAAGRALVDAELTRELARVRAFNRSLGLVRVTMELGSGDEPAVRLRETAKRLSAVARDVDLLGRLDDRSLLLLCPEISLAALEAIRAKLQALFSDGPCPALVELRHLEGPVLPSREELFQPPRSA